MTIKKYGYNSTKKERNCSYHQRGIMILIMLATKAGLHRGGRRHFARFPLVSHCFPVGLALRVSSGVAPNTCCRRSATGSGRRRGWRSAPARCPAQPGVGRLAGARRLEPALAVPVAPTVGRRGIRGPARLCHKSSSVCDSGAALTKPRSSFMGCPSRRVVTRL